MKTVLVIIQSVMHNRGSEALSRGISYICKSMNEDVRVILNSAENEFPGKLALPHVDEYVKRLSFSSKKSPKALLAAAADKVLKNKTLAAKLRYGKLLCAAKQADVIVVMAGDNFDVSPTYNFDGNSFLYGLLKKQNNAKLVMYDCSMGAENINQSIVRGFNKCDAVTARDSISLENLKNAGVKNVEYFPDPAFVMQPEKCSLPAGWAEGKMMGLNLSNLILRSKYGGDKEKVFESYYNLIDYVLSETDMHIALVPHVMNNADMSVLRPIYEKYKESGKVVLLPESLSAPQLKYVISNCEIYVGARTHSTIAAYSSCVPTLVIGYSVKSKGIAKDLFGTYEHFVVPVYNIEDDRQITCEVKRLIENKDRIKAELQKKIPGYSKAAMDVQKLL